MIDLSKHIQEGARLELEALEQSMDEGSFLSAQNSAQAMQIDELKRDLAAANARADGYRDALIKVRAHTSYVAPPNDDRSGLMQGLLISIERIADAAIAGKEKPNG